MNKSTESKIKECANRIIEYKHDRSINWRYNQNYFYTALCAHIKYMETEKKTIRKDTARLVDKAREIWEYDCENQNCTFITQTKV